MDELPGSFGTSASFSLRLGQAVFAAASLFFMCFDADFYAYTAFCYLVTVMGLVAPWSLTLALFDAYSVLIKRLHPQDKVLSIILSGDFVLSFLSLAAACSAASVTDVMFNIHGPFCHEKMCSRYQVSASMAFLSCFLSFASTLFNLWIFPSVFSH